LELKKPATAEEDYHLKNDTHTNLLSSHWQKYADTLSMLNPNAEAFT
jgi:hypothetical protein